MLKKISVIFLIVLLGIQVNEIHGYFKISSIVLSHARPENRLRPSNFFHDLNI